MVTTKKRTTRYIACLRVIIVLLAVTAIALGVYWILQRPKPNRNALAIGASAKSPMLAIDIQAPVELDFRSKEEILKLREQAVYRHRELISGDYEPSDAVFGQIKSEKPWWGIQGQFYFGSGPDSIQGPAEESRFILNPFLLLAADFYGFEWMYDRSRLTKKDLGRTDFPFTCYPQSLTWWPDEARAEVAYNVTRWITEVNRWTPQPVYAPSLYFDLISYNARDMNLNYVYIAYDLSLNVAKENPPGSAFEISHYLHLGSSCGYEGGCNNMSPPTPEIDGIRIDGLPAQAIIWLWREKPDSVSRAPDMTFIMKFE